MNIIKIGRTLNTAKLFTCYRCGCEFEAEEDEYWAEEEKENKGVRNLYTCCPCCRKIVTTTVMTGKPDGYLLSEQMEKLNDYMKKLKVPVREEYYKNIKNINKGSTNGRE